MKKINIVSIVTCLLCILLAYEWHVNVEKKNNEEKTVTVGIILDGDESTPYNNNFLRAVPMIEAEYGDRVKVIPIRNIHLDHEHEALDELVEAGCDIIFTTSYGYGNMAKVYAGRYPDIVFCEATCDNANTDPVYPNYHTFMGRIYEGRYISGVVAGYKLEQMIAEGEISADEAIIGYVAAYSTPEIISGYTAFFLGVRSVVPSARMKVCYTDTWSDYTLEKSSTEKLIEEGCVIISQHSDTIGPAIACEEASEDHPVYHVGYNQSMLDVAPTAALVSCRINWIPYMIDTVGAVLEDKKIEDYVDAAYWGNDMCAGFDKDWVQMIELNEISAAPGTQQKIEELEEEFKRGSVHVFKGDYIGVNPDDPSDTWDLNNEYIENRSQSAPSFHYILNDAIEIIEISD
ncbi:MAG: BMP family ABC transporter substrate-binding protein [Eubacterium sp.]|nr:BMP family ABC transporter substrate-binding protein [Eubacterium sp.]